MQQTDKPHKDDGISAGDFGLCFTFTFHDMLRKLFTSSFPLGDLFKIQISNLLDQLHLSISMFVLK